MEETSAIINRLSAVTLISPMPPPSVDASSWLPFDLVEEILARLPVKFLLQFRCVCKSWNSLITDNPKFAKKHLRFSKTNHRRLVLNAVSHSKNTPRKYLVKSYPIESPFTTTNKVNQFHYPPNSYDDGEFPLNNIFLPVIGYCDGILFLNGHDNNALILWNPFIGKSRELPPLEKVSSDGIGIISFGFGYDSLSDNYKVVAVYDYRIYDTRTGYRIRDTQVRVHSLGTNFWRNIQEFPPYSPIGSPKFVSGKLHWLTLIHGNKHGKFIIVSLDLGNESYQEVMQPDYGEEVALRDLDMGVLNDCLSMRTRTSVWVMKEYGNKESWTKIFSFPEIEGYAFSNAIYIFEDDQVLLEAIRNKDFKLKLVVYDSKNGIVNFHKMDNTPKLMVESLISP